MVGNNTHSKVFNAILTSITKTFQDHLKVTCVFSSGVGVPHYVTVTF